MTKFIKDYKALKKSLKKLVEDTDYYIINDLRFLKDDTCIFSCCDKDENTNDISKFYLKLCELS